MRQQGTPKMTKLACGIFAAVGVFHSNPRGDTRARRIECRGLGQDCANPVGNLISVPFQENAYFDVGTF